MSKDARAIFAENIEALLKRTGCTQADLVRELGLRQSTVSDWMGGKKYPRVDNLQLLADFFGVARWELTEEGRASEGLPGTAQWLSQGLEARGVARRGELTGEQLEAILQSMDVLAKAFTGREG